MDVGCNAALVAVPVVDTLSVEPELAEEEGFELVEDVELLGELVDKTCPVPSNTTPLFSTQQAGSLSQQKLPSLHVATRGRRPLGDPIIHKVSGLLPPTGMSKYHSDKVGNNSRQSMGKPGTRA